MQPILVSGATLLLFIDVVETAVHRVARVGTAPQRGFDTDHVRHLLADRLGCDMDAFEAPWRTRSEMPPVWGFLRRNAHAVRESKHPFDAMELIEVQMGFEKVSLRDYKEPGLAYYKLIGMINRGELTEADFKAGFGMHDAT